MRLALRLCYQLLLLTVFIHVASAQVTGTSTINADRGTLTFNYRTYTTQCEVSPGRIKTQKVTGFDTFVYTEAGVATPLNGAAEDGWGATGVGGTCDPNYVDPVTLKGSTFQVVFTPQNQSGSATASYFEIGYVNPKYIVVGVTYAPPGTSSTVQYTKSTFLGKTSTLSSSFSSSNSVTATLSNEVGIKGWASGHISVSSGYSYTQAVMNSQTIAISAMSSISNTLSGTPYFPPAGPVNHNYDVIWLWLNPVAIFTVDPNNSQNIAWNGFGYDMNDQPAMDIYPVQVGYLNGAFGPLPPSYATVLARSWASSQTFASGDGPGVTSADYPTILAADPFSNSSYSVALAPNVSPATTNDGRFTISGGTGGVSQSFVYQQASPGSNPSTQSFSNTYTQTSTLGQGATATRQTTFGVDVAFSNTIFFDTLKYDLKYQNQLTWTDMTNTAVTNTGTQVDSLTITGPPCNASTNPCVPQYTGPGEFNVYQDNIYGTFIFNPVN